MLINSSAISIVMTPRWHQGWWIVVFGPLVVLAFLVRINALKVQDRLIRLEERLAPTTVTR